MKYFQILSQLIFLNLNFSLTPIFVNLTSLSEFGQVRQLLLFLLKFDLFQQKLKDQNKILFRVGTNREDIFCTPPEMLSQYVPCNDNIWTGNTQLSGLSILTDSFKHCWGIWGTYPSYYLKEKKWVEQDALILWEQEIWKIEITRDRNEWEWEGENGL